MSMADVVYLRYPRSKWISPVKGPCPLSPGAQYNKSKGKLKRVDVARVRKEEPKILVKRKAGKGVNEPSLHTRGFASIT
jgi:hypothetical protein